MLPFRLNVYFALALLCCVVALTKPGFSQTVAPSPTPTAASSALVNPAAAPAVSPLPVPSATPLAAITFGGIASVSQTWTSGINAVGNLANGGVYNIPVVGVSGNRTLQFGANTNTYGPVPLAYVSLNPTDNFSVQAGMLATLIGQENTYTYLNPTIQLSEDSSGT